MTTIPNQKGENAKVQNEKVIENHKKIAKHLDTASKHHTDAAKHHEAENHEKAAVSTLNAHGHLILAREAHRENLKRLAL